MEYTSQPFTLQEAVNFDVSVISEEITRLQNSLSKLRETQQFLQSYLEATPDAEIAQALEENKVVIESQKERIAILKMALTEKGLLSASHYEIAPPSINHSQRSVSTSHTTEIPTPSDPPRQRETEEVEEGDPGVYL